MKFKLDFDTAYHQFYIKDKESLQDTGKSDFWTEDATYYRLAVGDGIIGIGIESYGHVNGDISLLHLENNNIEYIQYDHIVEAGLKLHSGVLQVLDCPNSNVELEVELKPGKYKVRIYSSNFSTVLNDSGDDYYKIEIWPDEDLKRAIIKQYTRL